jgi:hypothetical protein
MRKRKEIGHITSLYITHTENKGRGGQKLLEREEFYLKYKDRMCLGNRRNK